MTLLIVYVVVVSHKQHVCIGATRRVFLELLRRSLKNRHGLCLHSLRCATNKHIGADTPPEAPYGGLQDMARYVSKLWYNAQVPACSPSRIFLNCCRIVWSLRRRGTAFLCEVQVLEFCFSATLNNCALFSKSITVLSDIIYHTASFRLSVPNKISVDSWLGSESTNVECKSCSCARAPVLQGVFGITKEPLFLEGLA